MPSRQKLFAAAPLVVALLCGSPSAALGVVPAPMHTVAGLGSTSFPTSTKSAGAQASFLRGVLLLHLFQYADAAKAFRDAQRLDPGFAMAYWGEAMTYNHGVWNEVDEQAGREALAKLGPTPAARAAKAPTPREKAYLAAVELLYSGQGSKQARDAQYDQAMARLAANYPQDANAQLFHSLALMARSEGVRDVPAYLQAGHIAERIFKANPQDPGAAHYWIHAMDDPAHAASALVPARALAKIAPDADHAQHMTSHIFMALGLWDDVVAANEAALRVANADRQAAGRPTAQCGHYSQWLEYAYFQQGRFRDGQRLLQACAQSIAPTLAWANAHVAQLAARHTTPVEVAHDLNDALVQMRGIAVVESADGTGPAVSTRIDVSGLGASAGWNDFIDGYAAIARKELRAAQASADALSRLRATSKTDARTAAYLGILDDALQGLLQIRSGRADSGLRLLRGAATRYAAMPFDFGPPVPVKPPHELLGEELLSKGDAAAARAAFTAALKSAPRRTRSLLGRARAEAAVDDTAAAVATYTELVDILHAADPGLPALREARAFVAAHQHD